MPYVVCPSCTKTSYTSAAYTPLDLCPHCGAGLPARRRVVSAMAARKPADQSSNKAKPATA